MYKAGDVSLRGRYRQWQWIMSWLRLSLLLFISVTWTPVRSCCSRQQKLSASKFPEPPVRPTPAPPDLWFTAPPTGTTWSQQVKDCNESFHWELLEKVRMLVKVGKVLIWLGQWKQSRRQSAAKSGTLGSWTVQQFTVRWLRSSCWVRCSFRRRRRPTWSHSWGITGLAVPFQNTFCSKTWLYVDVDWQVWSTAPFVAKNQWTQL